ncbi:hypothetical protein H4582DRAFT_2127534 [Lactarius indigo]|nr:hypothetical protein H4582DRAFT_2127534 [Lactarius indigo]
MPARHIRKLGTVAEEPHFSKANQYSRDLGKTPFVIDRGQWSVLERSFECDIMFMARSEGLALAPWGSLGGWMIRTNAEEARRRESGEEGRMVFHSNWERSEDYFLQDNLVFMHKHLVDESVTPDPAPTKTTTSISHHVLLRVLADTSFSVTRTANQTLTIPVPAPLHPMDDLAGTNEVAAFFSRGSMPSFVTVSMRGRSTPILLSAHPAEDRENKLPNAISLDHGPVTNINNTTSDQEPDESQADTIHSSSSERSYSGRGRYKSVSIQVLFALYHLGESAALPDPEKVDECVLFGRAPYNMTEKGGGVFEKQVLAPGFLPGSPSPERSEPDQAVSASSVGSADVSLAGMVLTPECKMTREPEG